MKMRIRHAIMDPKLQKFVSNKYTKPMKEIYTDPYLTFSALKKKEVKEELRMFQIINQLKNWGIGRLFTSTELMRKYDEPSYWKLTRVQADTTAQELDYGIAWGLFYWRGRCEEIEKEITNVNEHMWRIIPKEDEHLYSNYVPISKPLKELPLYVPVPPILNQLLITEKFGEVKNGTNTQEAQVKLMVSRHRDNIYRQKLQNGSLE